MSIQPLKRSGNSANIIYYGEPKPESEGRVWCEVLVGSIDFTTDPPSKRPRTRYHFRVYRGYTDNKVAEFTYEPATTRGVLPARTVTRLVREALANEEEE